MTLFEAINNPGTGAQMRRALKVLAKEWHRRSETCPCGDWEQFCDNDSEAHAQRCADHDYIVRNMPLSLLQRQLKKLGACRESIAWAGQFSTARQAWEACQVEAWMRWLVQRLGDFELSSEVCNVACGEINSPEALAAIRHLVPFEHLRELSRGK